MAACPTPSRLQLQLLLLLLCLALPSASAVLGHAQILATEAGARTAAPLLPNPWWPGPQLASVPPGALPVLAASTAPTASGTCAPALERVLCVVDGRAVLPAQPQGACAWHCALGFLSLGGFHWVAAYGVGAGGAALLGQPLLLRREAPPAARGSAAAAAAAAQLAAHHAALAALTPPRSAALGVYYTTYLSPLAQLYQNITRATGLTRTTEAVLRNASLRLADSVWGPGAAAASPPWRNYSQTCDLMHQQPALGMYCLYRKRANESAGPMPDCPEAPSVLQAHAALLSASGFALVAPDFTNWDGDPRTGASGGASGVPGGSDFYQLRPLEVLAEEWASARLAGAATPQLSVFAMVNQGGALWRWYMDELFNNQTLLDLGLVFHDAQSGRKLFIAADLGSKTDAGALAAIAANGGRNDTVVPLMWFAPNASGAWEDSGRLAYFSRCIARHEGSSGAPSGSLDFSSDAWLDPGVPCGHLKTRASPIGGSWTVSTGLSLNSVPFGAVRFNGLLLKKQWWDVLGDAEPTALIFSPSWNEFGSRAYPLAADFNVTNPAFYAAGAAPDDPHRAVLCEDGYGAARSRTIEPSVEDGGRYYEAFASCVRVYRLQAYLGIVSNGTGCSVAGEDCCELRDDERFVRAWSLDFYGSGGGVPSDSLLTSDARERAALAEGGWVEVCVPTLFGRGPTGVCVDGALPFATGAAGVDAASRGPLALRAPLASSAALPGAVPLVRCGHTASGRHFAANSSSDCAARGGAAQALLGYGADAPCSLFARPLRRCRAARGGRWYTAVNVPCLAGDEDEGRLMYVV